MRNTANIVCRLVNCNITRIGGICDSFLAVCIFRTGERAKNIILLY